MQMSQKPMTLQYKIVILDLLRLTKTVTVRSLSQYPVSLYPDYSYVRCSYIRFPVNIHKSYSSNSFLIHRPGIKKSADNKRVVDQRVVKNQGPIV